MSGKFQLVIYDVKKEDEGVVTARSPLHSLRDEWIMCNSNLIVESGCGESRSDQKSINVADSDRPDRPENVFVTNIDATSCVVHWSPPLDVGGPPVENYSVEVGSIKVCQYNL